MDDRTDLSDDTAALLAAASRPVDHEKLLRDVRAAIADPPDMTAVRAQLGLPDRLSRRRVA